MKLINKILLSFVFLSFLTSNLVSQEDVEKAIKSINEIACCYIEFYPYNKNPHQLIESIMPSPEETSARIRRKEKELPIQLYKRDYKVKT